MAKKKRNKKTKSANRQNKITPPNPPVNSQVRQSQDPQPQTNFNAKITMLSDWHIGSGAGIPGDVDRLIQRDADGLPYIPAKTLTGIWRDGCELVALGLDNDTPGQWMKWVDYLFGDQPALAEGKIEVKPRESALSIRSAHLPKNLRKLLAVKSEDLSKAKITPEQQETVKGRLALKAALTFNKAGISIDADSGCAIPDFLRFEEMARGGCILTAFCELQLPEIEDFKEQCSAAYALLVAGAKLVDRLGGKRRRGAGKCKLEIEVSGNIEKLDFWLNYLDKEAPDLPQLSNTENKQTSLDQYKGNEWSQITLDVETLSPVIIPKRTVGNVTESLDYIPGTYLLTLISRKLGKLGINLGNAIAHGDLIVTNATIAIDDQPSCPVPFALFAKKIGGGLQEGHVYNRLKEEEPSDQLKQVRQGYIHPVCQNGLLPKSDQVTLKLETHNTVKDEVQRPSGAGGVYSYEAITPGTKLKAHLRLRQGLVEDLRNKDPNWWHRLNGKRDRLGQSKKDDYGLVIIKSSEPEVLNRYL
ncbi:hypothetical protein K4A83_22105 [Spirulina subsalsa FACHB-351]|uniref:CRISPR type III-associated protein domain-containing protein n=1 Tax=Spirulina subsalsa FACHB-351 TaxID=234711 RepID=A0ABT3LBN1_9CYAN|nr:RAMP superfamily CRISPR-associated protein [Spirulina subsalsa]MCW6038924.1 hypothetical protein [Spirulina subsalsa FACHB-351]